MKPIIAKILSGGQTGVDIAGLRAARACDIPTGGWAPKGYMTEDGPKPKRLKSYGLQEHKSDRYPARTLANINDSDCTLIIANLRMMGGSALTRDLCFKVHKPVFGITISDLDDRHSFKDICAWIRKRGSNLTVNIAGHRESVHPGIEQKAEDFLTRLFESLNGS